MKYLLILLFVSISNILWAQTNGGFENNSVNNCRQCCNEAFLPFNVGKVPDWQASHGSPQINKSDAGCPTVEEADVHSGSEAAFLSYAQSNKEGIFQNINIIKDESFNVSLFAKGLNNKIIVKFTNGLVNSDGSNATSIPNPSSQQLVIEQVLTDTWQEVRVDEIIADADYSQVWIYALDGPIVVDDFSFFESCCEPYKLWQNITNPPSTYVNNYIQAGENIDTSQTTGKVIITADADPISFEAGQHIELLPGFETEPGASFKAEIKDCGEKELEISLLEIAPYSPSGYISPTCNTRYEVAVCYGSGDYTISWDNGAGIDMASDNWPDQSKTISLLASQWLFVTVVDNITHDTIQKGVHIAASPFSGSFNIDLFNIITPDGDGLNDEWYAIDSTKLGKDSFGYNAYEYELWFYDRWGGEEHYSSGLNKKKGFAYNEINWIDDYCNVTSAFELFGILKLSNCSQTETIEFLVTLICESSESYILSLDSTSNKPSFLVFPNPTRNILTISSNGKPAKGIQLYNNLGSIIRDVKPLINGEIQLELKELSSGSYTLRILTSNDEIITKGIIIK